MFETISTRCVKPKNISWDAPTLMSFDIDDSGLKTYKLLKGACDFLHSKIDVKFSTSKDLFKKSPDMWKQFRDEQLQKARDTAMELASFYLDKPSLVYIVNDRDEVVDMIDLYNEEDYADFELKHQQFKLEVTAREVVNHIATECKNGLCKIICYDKDIDIFKQEYTPIVIMEVNNQKSTYETYNGIMICTLPDSTDMFSSEYTIMPSLSPNIEEKSLCTFISYFDMPKMLDYAREKGDELYDAYKLFSKKPVEISAREMTSLFKSLGYKFVLDDGDTLHPFDNMADETNRFRIQEYYDTFRDVTGESAYEILEMSDLKRTFRFNKLTLLEVLTILSKEYVYYDNYKINADVLSDIVYKLFYNKNVDKVQSEDVKNEIV